MNLEESTPFVAIPPERSAASRANSARLFVRPRFGINSAFLDLQKDQQTISILKLNYHF